jgi:hypothetical protein
MATYKHTCGCAQMSSSGGTGGSGGSGGCSASAAVGAEGTEGIVTGSVEVGGTCSLYHTCFNMETSSDTANFVPIGVISVGQCLVASQGCKNDSTIGEQCNENFAACAMPGVLACTNWCEPAA